MRHKRLVHGIVPTGMYIALFSFQHNDITSSIIIGLISDQIHESRGFRTISASLNQVCKLTIIFIVQKDAIAHA